MKWTNVGHEFDTVGENLQKIEKIYFSAGKRGVQIILDPEVLAEVSNAEFVDLTK